MIKHVVVDCILRALVVKVHLFVAVHLAVVVCHKRIRDLTLVHDRVVYDLVVKGLLGILDVLVGLIDVLLSLVEHHPPVPLGMVLALAFWKILTRCNVSLKLRF